MIRGSSGANVVKTRLRVYKWGNDRVVQQGRWLQAHPTPALPRVLQVGVDGYSMELLAQPPTWALDHVEVMRGVLRALESDVWSQPPVVSPRPSETRERTEQLIRAGYSSDDPRQTAVRRLMLDTFDHVRWGDLRRCLTHGDATFDNIMFRDDQLVMIDPLPATMTTAVPDLWSVDVGHVLRSALGFERVRYDDDSLCFKVTPEQLKSCIASDNEWLAASFWALFHLLRTLPYQPDDTTRERMRTLTYESTTRLL